MEKLKALWDLFKTTFWEWWNDNTFRLSASLAFYTLFSLAPLILIAVTLVGAVAGGRAAALEQITGQVSTLIGEEGGRAVMDVAEATSLQQNSTVALLIGIVTLVVGSTVVFAELQAALNEIWDVQVSPEAGFVTSLLRARLRSFAIALGVGFLLMVSLVISAALAAAQAYFEKQVPGGPWLWRLASLVLGFIIIALLFAMIYKFLPDVKITWGDVAIGAAVTAVLFSAGKYAIGAYLGQMAIGSAYGAAGSLAVLLVWVYYSALISFFGAEFTQVYARRYGSRIRPEDHAVRIGRKADEA